MTQDRYEGRQTTLTVLDNGDLEIAITPGADIDWDRMLSERDDQALHMLIEDIRDNSEWSMVDPVDIAALTDAPIISDGVAYPDSGAHVVFGRVWWFPRYTVENPIETLRNEGRVVFTWSGDPPMVPRDCEACKAQGCSACKQLGMILTPQEVPRC